MRVLSVMGLLFRRWPELLSALLFSALAAALLPGASADRPEREADVSAQFNYVIGPGHEAEIQEALDLDTPEPGPSPGTGFRTGDIAVKEDRIRVEYRTSDGRVLPLTIHHPNAICAGCLRSPSVAIQPGGDDPDSARLAARLLERLGPDFTALWQDRSIDLDQREAAQGLELAEPRRLLGRHPAELWLLVDHFLWLLLGVLGSWQLIASLRRGPRSRPLHAAALLALLAGALGLRIARATWGPGDLYLNVAEVFWGKPSVLYGNAPNALLLMLFEVLPAATETLVAVTLVLGTLAVGLAWLLARELAPEDAWFRWCAGLAVAAQPILVRFSGEANRQMYVLSLGTLALWSWVRWERHGRLLDGAAGVVAATLCVHSRPEAFPLLLLLALISLRPPRREGGGRPRWSPILLAMAFGVYAAYWATSFRASSMQSTYVGNLFSPGRFFLGPSVNLWLDPAFTPAALIAFLPLGLLAAARRRARWAGWVAAGLLGFAVMATSMPTGGDGVRQLASARYQTLAVLLASLASAWGTAELLRFVAGRWPRRGLPVAIPLLLLLVAGTGVSPFLGVTRPTTLDHEYRLM
ncbi:MAG: hypothetical protein FJ098_10230, partial [Deltaproteobacteria bacterium]|nr:hypothetical protein [Deltaproteobacteria bacterium]